MTILSCIAIGIAFILAVALLVLAATVIGLRIPVRREKGPRPPGEDEE